MDVGLLDHRHLLGGTAWLEEAREVAAFARNITDEDNVLGVIDFNNNTAFVNEPRVIGAMVSFKY